MRMYVVEVTTDVTGQDHITYVTEEIPTRETLEAVLNNAVDGNDLPSVSYYSTVRYSAGDPAPVVDLYTTFADGALRTVKVSPDQAGLRHSAKVRVLEVTSGRAMTVHPSLLLRSN